ncbi:unnamed protein product [Miscanthus lutarioriparius]|uniref:Uncharacterized protein n=1 Tax=Miscanthus lutarioriparius TaxID=422564 RepID=A0A811NBI4_9POAL|nr:unnamed protein product [Miscanthus lutarioriparius]
MTMANTTVRGSKRIARHVSLARVSPKCGERCWAPPGRWDVADFMRFHLVCKLWMKGSGTKKPHELGEPIIDHRFHPQWWILMTEPTPEATPTRRKLLSVTTRKIIMVDLPKLDGHAVLPGLDAASEGMLVDDNVADFTWFRLVCKLWMAGSGTEKPCELGEHVIDHCFHPRLWILLMDTYHNMLNMATRKIIMVDLLELDGHAMVLGLNTALEGMLVVREERTLVMCLKFLTHHIVDHPTLRTL